MMTHNNATTHTPRRALLNAASTQLLVRVTGAAMSEFRIFIDATGNAGIKAGQIAVLEGKDFAGAMAVARRAAIRAALKRRFAGAELAAAVARAQQVVERGASLSAAMRYALGVSVSAREIGE